MFARLASEIFLSGPARGLPAPQAGLQAEQAGLQAEQAGLQAEFFSNLLKVATVQVGVFALSTLFTVRTV